MTRRRREPPLPELVALGERIRALIVQDLARIEQQASRGGLLEEKASRRLARYSNALHVIRRALEGGEVSADQALRSAPPPWVVPDDEPQAGGSE